MGRINWAGNLAYAAADTVVPATLAEAQSAVRAAAKLRATGSRHCFNDIADTPGTHLSLEKLNRLLSIDKTKLQVTVEGGIRYGELGPELHAAGYALHNLASLPHISVAGACATATHGSGVKLGALHTAVTAIEFINAAGDPVTLSREKDSDTFAGAVVGLGAVGVVSKLTLAIEPAFDVRQDVYRDLPLAEAEAHFDEIMGAGYSVSLFTVWQGDAIEQVWVKRKSAAGGGLAAAPSFFGATPARTNMHPVATIDPVNCTDQMGIVGPAYDRLPHFRMGYTPASGEELQVEYFVPAPHAVAAMKAIRGLGDRLAPVLIVSEVRTIAADDFWMSPFYRQPCVAFHFSFRQDWAATRPVLTAIEAALAPFAPRPHWGKLFTMAPAAVQARYPRLADFRDLLATHDPKGKFRNAFVEKYVFG